MSLYNAMTSKDALTANGGLTNSTSGQSLVDLFFLFGASRGKDIAGVFHQAMAEDTKLAARMLLWGRDIRGGAGERDQFRKLVVKLPADTQAAIISKIPEVGRWDDLLVFIGTKVEKTAVSLLRKALDEDNGLCAKWMPRPNKGVGKVLWRKLGYRSPKEYRKHIANLTKAINVVEQKMCAGEWDSIDFNKITSMNHIKYPTAFFTHCEKTYTEYKSKLEKGEAKINAGAVYPYNVIELLKKHEITIANEMWKALPDYLEGSDERIMPLVDVSGSMWCAAGKDTNVSCMDVAVSLGLYISERVQGVFKGQFMTFETTPRMYSLKGSLYDRYELMKRAPWGGSTNIQRAFNTLLTKAKEFNVSESEMPTKILILSDMEFNSSWVGGKDVTALDMMKAEYEKAGYKMPQLVFWNLNGRSGNIPMKSNTQGVAAVSGFSPSLMKSLLGGEDFTPKAVMMKTIMDSRYDF